MARSSSFALVDRILDGGLEAELRQMRADGLSLDSISRAFAARGIDISRETVRRWLKPAA